MADQDILSIPSAPDEGTIPESTLAPGPSTEHAAGETDGHGGLSVPSASNGNNRSARPLPGSKSRPERQSYPAAIRHGNYGMTPRRFVTLRESDPKPTVSSPDPNREARAARGVRRALWIIAIATAVNVGVAGLQWYELHRAYGPTRSVDAAGLVNHAALP
jgi:hypothetical protein